MAQAWKIAFMELKHRWVSLCGMILFALLVGAIIGSELRDFALYGTDRIDHFMSGALDFLLIAVLPCFGGLTFGREYFSFSSTISEEPFLRRLRFYRMFPFPLELIVQSRVFFMLICFLATVPLTFILTTVLAWPHIGMMMSGSEFFNLILIWFGYALAMIGVIPYLEFGHNGKVLIFSTFVSTAIVVLVIVGCHVIVGQSIFMLTIQAVQTYSWIPGIVMLLIAAVANFIWQNKLKSRIAKRDFP